MVDRLEALAAYLTDRTGTSENDENIPALLREAAEEIERLRASRDDAQPSTDCGNPPCGQCGGPHPFDTVVPSAVWNSVVRAQGISEYLCLACIVRSFAVAGKSFTATLIGRLIPETNIEVIINGQYALDALIVSDENTELRARINELERDDASMADKPAETERWVPVSERMPDPCKYVLCNCEEIGMASWQGVGYLKNNVVKNDWHIGDWHTNDVDIFVSHWMPLPAPPAAMSAEKGGKG